MEEKDSFSFLKLIIFGDVRAERVYGTWRMSDRRTYTFSETAYYRWAKKAYDQLIAQTKRRRTIIENPFISSNRFPLPKGDEVKFSKEIPPFFPFSLPIDFLCTVHIKAYFSKKPMLSDYSIRRSVLYLLEEAGIISDRHLIKRVIGPQKDIDLSTPRVVIWISSIGGKPTELCSAPVKWKEKSRRRRAFSKITPPLPFDSEEDD